MSERERTISGRSDVPHHKYAAVKAVLAERERELLRLKGPCSTEACRLHRAHAGPCDVPQLSARCVSSLSADDLGETVTVRGQVPRTLVAVQHLGYGDTHLIWDDGSTASLPTDTPCEVTS